MTWTRRKPTSIRPSDSNTLEALGTVRKDGKAMKTFKTFRTKGVRYLMFPVHGNIALLDEDGNHYGAFTLERDARKYAAEREPIGRAALRIVHLEK